MFFSCCDWESAMVKDTKCKLNYQEVSVFNTDSKRVKKMTEKDNLVCSNFGEQSAFDVDAVMKKSGSSSHPERNTSTKKLLSKRPKKMITRPKKIEINS